MYSSQKYIEEAIGAALRQGVGNVTRVARTYAKDGTRVIKRSAAKAKDAGAQQYRNIQTRAKIQKEKIRADMLNKKAKISERIADVKPKVSEYVSQKKLDSANTVRAGLDRLRAQKTDVQTKGRAAISKIQKSLDTMKAAKTASRPATQ
ncbi:MAG: hypothetical protein KAS32_08450 [Candidatus Peribacteraceae bacterium]|nr:hypothetical protein [Candidatus Peribacteraceae bacterium]